LYLKYYLIVLGENEKENSRVAGPTIYKKQILYLLYLLNSLYYSMF